MRFWIVLLILLIVPAKTLAETNNCGPNETAVATRPIPPQRSWSWGKYQEVAGFLAKKPDVVLVGDSLAARWPDSRLQRLFPGQTVANFGLGSDRTQITLWRLDQVQPGIAAPSTVLIVLGTNNIPEVYDLCGVTEGIKAVMAKIRAMWPTVNRIYLFGILPRGKEFAEFATQISTVNQSFQKLAASDPLVVYVPPPAGIDCHIRPAETFFDTAMEYFMGPATCDFYDSDNLHLSESGYELLGETLVNIAKQHPSQ